MNKNTYDKPSLTVDAVILSGNDQQMKLLVVERKNSPFKGKLVFPGGFINQYEIPYKAMLRELFEETSLNLENFRRGVPLKLRGMKGRDPRGWTITIPYLFYLPKPLKVKAGDDAKKAFWIKLAELNELAFDHGAILCEALSYFWDLIAGRESIKLFSGPGFDSGSDSDYQGFAAPKYLEFKKKKELIFFGGSFFPWHQGHTSVLMSMPKNLRDKIIVVPDRNPLKEIREYDQYNHYQDEHQCAYKFYRHILSKVANIGVFVYPGFCGQEEANPTSSWLPYVKKSFSLLMGDDSFIGLKKWIDPEKFLLKTKKIYVVPRLDDNLKIAKSLKWIKSVNKNLIIDFRDHHQYQHISSTNIRNKI
ncbi:MAG: NUDIX domain-containing protein [Oligoflexia bacterium]|nr:NUDIX domain-containing protein [Oligoflexia bacterium]